MENNLGQNNLEKNSTTEELSPTPETSTQPQTEEKQNGGVVGIIIIVVLVVVGGLYYWGANANDDEAVIFDESATAENILEAPDNQADALSNQGTSDEVSAIEEDLNLTGLDELDAELKAIEKELNF